MAEDAICLEAEDKALELVRIPLVLMFEKVVPVRNLKASTPESKLSKEDFEKNMEAQLASGWVDAVDLEKIPEVPHLVRMPLVLMFEKVVPVRNLKASTLDSKVLKDDSEKNIERERASGLVDAVDFEKAPEVPQRVRTPLALIFEKVVPVRNVKASEQAIVEAEVEEAAEKTQWRALERKEAEDAVCLEAEEKAAEAAALEAEVERKDAAEAAEEAQQREVARQTHEGVALAAAEQKAETAVHSVEEDWHEFEWKTASDALDVEQNDNEMVAQPRLPTQAEKDAAEEAEWLEFERKCAEGEARFGATPNRQEDKAEVPELVRMPVVLLFEKVVPVRHVKA